jgi:hypothetical protein
VHHKDSIEQLGLQVRLVKVQRQGLAALQRQQVAQEEDECPALIKFFFCKKERVVHQ